MEFEHDPTIDILEQQRVALQGELDAQKTQAERNRLGQFATPTPLAQDILDYAATLLPSGEPVRFLDPAIGTGSFYSALCKVFPADASPRLSASRSTRTMADRPRGSGRIPASR